MPGSCLLPRKVSTAHSLCAVPPWSRTVCKTSSQSRIKHPWFPLNNSRFNSSRVLSPLPTQVCSASLLPSIRAQINKMWQRRSKVSYICWWLFLLDPSVHRVETEKEFSDDEIVNIPLAIVNQTYNENSVITKSNDVPMQVSVDKRSVVPINRSH